MESIDVRGFVLRRVVVRTLNVHRAQDDCGSVIEFDLVRLRKDRFAAGAMEILPQQNLCFDLRWDVLSLGSGHARTPWTR